MSSDAKSQGPALIPIPVELKQGEGHFVLQGTTTIVTNGRGEELKRIANYLTDHLNRATGYDLKVLTSQKADDVKNVILLALNEQKDATLGNEGYAVFPAFP